jgi:hypothetical protein
MIDDGMQKVIRKFFGQLEKEIKILKTKEEIEEKIKKNFY